MIPWRQVVLLMLAAAFVGGLAGAFVTRNDDRALDDEGRGTVVRFGPREGLNGIEDGPFCLEFHHFCIVKTESGDFLALYTYDPNVRFRSQGCDVSWLPDFRFVDPETQQDKPGWFRGRCSGSTFDMEGRRVFGPSPRDLDQFPLRIVGKDSETEYIEVDTRQLICGAERLDFNEPCERAPRPE